MLPRLHGWIGGTDTACRPVSQYHGLFERKIYWSREQYCSSLIVELQGKKLGSKRLATRQESVRSVEPRLGERSLAFEEAMYCRMSVSRMR